MVVDDDEGYFRINGKGAQLVFANNNGKVQTPIDPKSGLPMLTMFHNVDDAAEKLEIAMHSCVAAENNQNLSPSQKEMLRWHFRLGHASMSAMHWLARRGLLGKLSERLLRANETPLCATCHHGKQVRRPTGTTLATERSDKIGGIRDGKLEPGDEIAVDQCEVSKRGRRTETGGKEKEKEKFSCGTMFCDVATGFAKCYPQISTGAFDRRPCSTHPWNSASFPDKLTTFCPLLCQATGTPFSTIV